MSQAARHSPALPLFLLLLAAGCRPPEPAVPPAETPPAETPPAQAPPAQAPPATDVFLLAIDDAGVGAPRNLSDRVGYDNQPAFLPDGAAIVYTSIDDAGQADVLRYDLASGARTAVTRTPESEYSPTPIPGDPGAISVVRVEADGRQRLWRFALAGGAPELLLPELEPVGYHAWIDDERTICFVLGEPPTLRLATVGAAAAPLLAENVGRALARIPGDGRMSFVHKRGADGWWVTAVDPASGELEPLVRTRPEREDYAWAPDGSLWMGDGGVLYRWRPGTDDWRPIADLAPHGLDDVTRLAFHTDGSLLALVARRPGGDPE